MSHSDWLFFDFPKYLKEGSYIINDPYLNNVKTLVESTTKTITVKAGTFKNTVILRAKDGSRFYLVKGIGVIKETDKNGKVLVELSSVK